MFAVTFWTMVQYNSQKLDLQNLNAKSEYLFNIYYLLEFDENKFKHYGFP